MPRFTTLTGFGYFKNANDEIVAKFDLPCGEHEMKEGFSAFDVAQQSDLEVIQVAELVA